MYTETTIKRNPNVVPKFEVGETVRIEGKGIKFQGNVIAVTESLVVVKNKNGYKESFKFTEFFCGDVKLTARKNKS
jgi:hypothetical protein